FCESNRAVDWPTPDDAPVIKMTFCLDDILTRLQVFSIAGQSLLGRTGCERLDRSCAAHTPLGEEQSPYQLNLPSTSSTSTTSYFSRRGIKVCSNSVFHSSPS